MPLYQTARLLLKRFACKRQHHSPLFKIRRVRDCALLKYSTVQCSTIQYSTVQYSVLQCSTVQYSTVQCSSVQHSTVQYSAVQCSAVQYSIVLKEKFVSNY